MEYREPLWWRLAAWLPLLLWVATIFYMSSQSSPTGASSVDLVPLVRGDLLVHFGLYFILGLCALLALSSIRGLKPRAAPYFLTVAAVMAVGAADEIYQSFVPLRSSSIFDWMADVTGGITAAGLASQGWEFVKQKLAKPELRN